MTLKAGVSIPLHLLITESADGFDSLCLEYTLSGYGKDWKVAVGEMIRDVAFFVTRASNEELVSRYSEDNTGEQWQAYRKAYMLNALAGSPHPIIERIRDFVNIIAKLQKELESLGVDVIVKESEITPVNLAA